MDIAGVAPKKSLFVNSLACLGIVHAAFFLFLIVLDYVILSLFSSFDQISKIFSRVQIFPGMPGVVEWMCRHLQGVFIAAGLGSLFILVVSIGLLQRKNWARQICIGIMGMGIILCLLPLFYHPAEMEKSVSVVSKIKELEGVEVMVQDMLRMLWIVIIGVSVLTALLFAWVIKKLMSVQIRNEFFLK